MRGRLTLSTSRVRPPCEKSCGVVCPTVRHVRGSRFSALPTEPAHESRCTLDYTILTACSPLQPTKLHPIRRSRCTHREPRLHWTTAPPPQTRRRSRRSASPPPPALTGEPDRATNCTSATPRYTGERFGEGPAETERAVGAKPQVRFLCSLPRLRLVLW